MTKNFTIEQLDLDDDRVAFVEAKPVGWAGTLKVSDVHEALKTAGVPQKLWPKEPSANKCLERAVKTFASRRTLVRPLSKSSGWAIVTEDETQLNLENATPDEDIAAHTVTLTCTVKKNSSGVFEPSMTPSEHPYADTIREEFDRWQDYFKCSQDLSIWFSQKIIPWCFGVATRARGGSYYIMKGEYLNRVRKIANALDELSSYSISDVAVGESTVAITKVLEGGRILLKPEVGTTAAVEVLLDNIISECDKVCDDLEAKVASDKLGHKALETQRNIAEQQGIKLREFENMLNMSLDDLRERLTDVESSVGLAALKALQQ